MKKAAAIAGFFLAVFIGTNSAAQAGTRFSFGISIGSPAVPYGYYYPVPAYPPYYTTYYADPSYSYPAYSYRTYVVPRYYKYRSYEPRYYKNYGKAKYKSNGRGRWKK